MARLSAAMAVPPPPPWCPGPVGSTVDLETPNWALVMCSRAGLGLNPVIGSGMEAGTDSASVSSSGTDSGLDMDTGLG